MTKVFFNLVNSSLSLATAKKYNPDYAIVEVEVDSAIVRDASECKLIAVHGLKPKPPVVKKQYRGVVKPNDYSRAAFPSIKAAQEYWHDYIGFLEETQHDGKLHSVKYIPRSEKE